jgi:uncharacterized protein (DUF1015 family)
MNIFPFSASLPKLKLIASADTFFSTVKYDYPLYRQNGFFNKSDHPSLFVYRIIGSTGTHTGLLACADVEDFLNGKILRHEETLAAKEQEMINLLIQRKALVKPVMLSHKPSEQLMDIYEGVIKGQAPVMELHFEKEAELHALWDVKEEEKIHEIQRIFSTEFDKLYIADGHHRTSTNAYLYKNLSDPEEAKNFRKLLAGFFSFDQFSIYDFNRSVEALTELTPSQFVAALSKYFDIEILKVPALPSVKHQITMVVNKEWYLLKWREEVLQQYSNRSVLLDAEVLDDMVFKKVLGIQDTRSDSRIQYISGRKGIPGLLKYVNADDKKVGFFLIPVEMQEVVTTAEEGRVLPPKSTWFEPRAKNGIVVKDVHLI